MVRGLAVLLVLAGACEKQERTAASPGTPAPPADGAHHPEAEKVFQACLATLQPSALPPADREIAITNACVDIHSVRGCREAYDEIAKASPSEASNILFTRCAAAYCPLLPAPRPAACDIIPDGHADRLAAWLMLEQAIVVFELGPDRARQLREAAEEQPPVDG